MKAIHSQIPNTKHKQPLLHAEGTKSIGEAERMRSRVSENAFSPHTLFSLALKFFKNWITKKSYETAFNEILQDKGDALIFLF